MQVVAVLERLGGVADAAALVSATSRGRVATALRRGEIVRDARGRYALPTADRAVRAARRLSGVTSHRSAAAYWGWETKTAPERPRVTVRPNRNLTAEQRHGVAVHYARVDPATARAGVTAPVRTVLDCASEDSFDEALAVADSAIRHRDVTRPDLLTAAHASPKRGHARRVRVAEHADGRAANPFESVLRAIVLDIPGLRVEPQVPIGLGPFTVHPDLVDVDRGLALEADSFAWHGQRDQLNNDCFRYTLLTAHGWVVLRFTWEQVMRAPAYVRTCVAVACGAAEREMLHRIVAA